MNKHFLKGYPINVRFGQYLVDNEQSAPEYFDVDDDEIKSLFADAVYNRFYTSEIGLEELDIFDLKMKGIFNANIDLYKGLYNARIKYIENIAAGVSELETNTGTDETTYGKTTTDETDADKKDVETIHTKNVVYTDVGINDDTKTREYKITHKDSGKDTRTPNLTRTLKHADGAKYAEMIRNAPDVFRAFTELFINLFMGVL